MLEPLAPSSPVSSKLVPLLFQLALPVLMALVMYVNLTRYDADHRSVWTVGIFLAGLGNAGFGSIVVALLYHTVE